MKYELIQEYPGSGKLGDVINRRDNPASSLWGYYYCYRWFDPSEFPSVWKAVRKVALTTEDGLDIYKGDRFAKLNTSNGAIMTVLNGGLLNVDYTGFMNFSTRGVAKAYWEAHGPKRTYTEEEVVKIVENWGLCFVDLGSINKFLDRE
jgi:hypothetical protein